MEGAESNKSEEATPFKLKRAREKGSVAKGLDLGFFTLLVALTAYMAVGLVKLGTSLAHSAIYMMAGIDVAPPDLMAMVVRAGIAFRDPILKIVIFSAILFAISLCVEFLQVGPVFSFHSLKPDFSRLNPVAGFKRIFNLKMLIEAIKSVFKIAIYCSISAYFIIWGVLGKGDYLRDASTVLFGSYKLVSKMLPTFAVAALIFAIIDQIIVRKQFSKKMRMSKSEVKREHRDREGEPRIKSRRKELHREFVAMATSLRGAKGADVILVNPTHYAVALRYRPEEMLAPKIVSRGFGEFAERIRKIGFAYGVVVCREPELTRALYRTKILDAEIPDAYYGKVADVYRKHVKSRKRDIK